MCYAILIISAAFLFGHTVRASDRGNVVASVPIVYSTDLYQQPDDPDDHFDLATLFAIKEFDIRGIIFDLGKRGVNGPGLSAA